MVNVTLTRFMMARSLEYLLHKGLGQPKNIRETLKLSHEDQNQATFAVQTLRCLDTTESYPNPRLNGLICIINPIYHLAKIKKFQHA